MATALVDRAVELGAQIGITPTTLISLVSPLLSIPCCFLLRGIASPAYRHLCAALTGLLLALYAFGPTIWGHYAVLVAFTYAAMALHRRRCGFITLVGTFAYLLACHIIYASGKARKDQGIDFAGTLMMVTLKLTSSAFDYQDGMYLVDADLPTPQRGTHRHLKTLPSVSQYMGYIFCGGLHLTGPFFELRPYLDWAENRGVWSHDARKAPFAIPLLVALAWATASGFIHLVLKPQLNLPLVTDPKRFYAIPYLHRWGHVIISTYAVRCKIYFVWTVAEASMIASGLGFSGWVPANKAAAPTQESGRSNSSETAAVNAAVKSTVITTTAWQQERSVLRKSLVQKKAPHGVLGDSVAGNAAKVCDAGKRAAKSPLRKNGGVTIANDENEAPEFGSKKSYSNGFLTACEETKDDVALAKENGTVTAATEQAKVAEVAQAPLVASWERAKNINIAGVELAKAFNAYAKNWNVSVGLWLRTYIYERTIPVGQKPGVFSLLLTVGVSAIWHGIYIGDFMFAFSGAFLIMGSRVIYRYQRTIPQSQRVWATIVQALHCLYSFAGLNYIAMGFIVLTAEDTLTVYRGLNFVGNLLPVVVLGGSWALRRVHALLHATSSSSKKARSSSAVSSSKSQRVIAAELATKQPEQQVVQLLQPVMVHAKVE
ncbi:hypothetical protein CLOM_g23074 [Closterium sp. NIES-68]|nr:hypothetical protein CLOM_g23074 [Closterium sp. NIES-68]GJP61513.1 hypothetical protein CLOP_g18667 [Closterium sp. NIES-67]GJP73278.1 hypothetical protein CLOP_g4016 [Closterium sp. NIES-67]